MDNLSQGIIFSGTGGDGTIFAVEIIAYMLDRKGYQVTVSQTYGPEQRSGLVCAECILAPSEKAARLFTETYDVLAAMDNASLERYEQAVIPGGLIVLNSTKVTNRPKRTDIRIIEINASTIAMKELNKPVVANMIMLGAIIAASGITTMDELIENLRIYLAIIGKSALFELDKTAVVRGAQEVLTK